MNEELNLDEAQVSRILHFVTPNGKCRPAVVVENWPGAKPGLVNLQVATDGSNDGMYGQEIVDGKVHVILTRHETSVEPNHKVRKPRTWHWPRECAHMVNPDA